MAKIVLFGGGDGGGLIITAEGVRPVPPFDPFVRAQLKAVANLVTAMRGHGSDIRELEEHAARIANVAVQEVEAIVGPLDEEASLIVMVDDGDGFTCGTTGKPPIPLPRPHRELPAVDSLMTRGGLDPALVAFVRKATEAGIAVNDLFERPSEVARELNLELPERTIRDLQVLAPSRRDALEDPVSREVAGFFERVLADGRYLDTWAIRPAAVAQNLGVQLSPPASDRIISVGSALSGRIGGGTAIIWIVVGIIVIIAVVIDEGEADIVDRSGVVKF